MNKQNAILSFLTIAFIGLFSIGAFALPPANDNFANAETIQQGISFVAHFSASNTDATSEAGEPNPNNTGIGKTVWYKWTAPANPRRMQITMHRSNFAVIIGVYTGTELNNLTEVTRSRFSHSTGNRSVVGFIPQSNTTYYFLVDGRSDSLDQTGLFGLDLSPAITRQSADFDFDGKSDIAVFRPSNGNWYILNSQFGNFTVRNWGASGDIPLTADFGGNPKSSFSDFPVFRPSNGTWYITHDFISAPPSYFTFGQANDFPVTGNTVNDGQFGNDLFTDIGVFRPSDGTWYFQSLTIPYETKLIRFGQAGDIPVHGDWDFDAITDVAVFRPSDGNWYINSSQNGIQSFHWGQNGDFPVRGDFDGDGRNDLAVFRPSNGTWFYRRSSNNTMQTFKWGTNGDIPISGDFDGDGKFDFAVFRPSNQTWYISSSSTGASTFLKWGTAGDVPISAMVNGN